MQLQHVLRDAFSGFIFRIESKEQETENKLEWIRQF
jgi:hypothetical protein